MAYMKAEQKNEFAKVLTNKDPLSIVDQVARTKINELERLVNQRTIQTSRDFMTKRMPWFHYTTMIRYSMS